VKEIAAEIIAQGSTTPGGITVKGLPFKTETRPRLQEAARIYPDSPLMNVWLSTKTNTIREGSRQDPKQDRVHSPKPKINKKTMPGPITEGSNRPGQNPDKVRSPKQKTGTGIQAIIPQMEALHHRRFRRIPLSKKIRNLNRKEYCQKFLVYSKRKINLDISGVV
jgi:hypothetical protein